MYLRIQWNVNYPNINYPKFDYLNAKLIAQLKYIVN